MKFPYKLIDLTHTIDMDIPTWNGDCGFEHFISLDYADCASEVKFRVGKFSLYAGIGTHLDAPAHCIPDGLTIDQIPLSQFLAQCVVIDVSAHCDEHYRITQSDIIKFEKQFLPITSGMFVMIKTGWERFWKEPKKYHNNHQFPSVSIEAAQYLFDKNICGLGIDTLSPDCPDSGYPVHQLLLGAGKWIVENAAHLDDLPVVGSFIMPVPIKVKNATEAPSRLLAFVQI